VAELEFEWFGLIDDAPCQACDWPDAPLSDGTRSFFLDLSSCTDPNGTYWFPLGLTVRDAQGLTHTVEHLVGLSCLP
jgi:hypothetical protein